jgi:hypothetical protein
MTEGMAVDSKQFNRYTGRSKLDSELGGAVTSTLLSLIEHESELLHVRLVGDVIGLWPIGAR